MKIYKLDPNGSSKSFCGKASVIEENGEKFLKSYETIVCKIDKNGNFIKLWDGYSTTTMRHINAFLAKFGIYGSEGSKKWWKALPVEVEKNTYYFIEDDYGGQHGSFIDEIKLTKDEYEKIKETRCYNGRKGVITDNYLAAYYYTYE